MEAIRSGLDTVCERLPSGRLQTEIAADPLACSLSPVSQSVIEMLIACHLPISYRADTPVPFYSCMNGI